MALRIVSVSSVAVAVVAAVVSLTTVAKPAVKSGRSGRNEQEADSWKNEKKNMKTAHKTCKLRPQIDEMKSAGAAEKHREREREKERGSKGRLVARAAVKARGNPQ